MQKKTVSVRPDAETLDMIEAERMRLSEHHGGADISEAQAILSLIRRGANAPIPGLGDARTLDAIRAALRDVLAEKGRK